MSEKLLLVQGDDLPVVNLLITDRDDNPVSIAGCTGANVYFRKVGQFDVQTIAAVVDTEAGTVSFDFSGGELSQPGDYEIEIELDFAGLKQSLYQTIRAKVRPQFA